MLVHLGIYYIVVYCCTPHMCVNSVRHLHSRNWLEMRMNSQSCAFITYTVYTSVMTRAVKRLQREDGRGFADVLSGKIERASLRVLAALARGLRDLMLIQWNSKVLK